VVITANGYDVPYTFKATDIDKCNICEKQNKWYILSTCSTSIPTIFILSLSLFLSDWLEAKKSIGRNRRILNRESNSSIISSIPVNIAMDDNSSSFVQLHRDDSGYGSPVLNREFLSPQQTSSNYYSYQHTYHPHMTYSNNSFHMYDQLITNNNNIYNSKDIYFTQ
jgi:hypothetical protein